MILHVPTNSPMDSYPQDYFPQGDSKTAHWYSLERGLDKGKKLFYYDYQNSEQPEQTFLFVHGNPENSYTYRHIRDELIASGKPMRIIAMDHIGFGLSDQADFEMVDMHHSANVLQLVEYLELTNITLIVHDWGGPIGVGAFIKQSSRVKNLLVMNTTIFPMPKEGFTYTTYPFRYFTWSMLALLVPEKLWGGVAAGVVCHASPNGFFPLAKILLKHIYLYASNKLKKDSPEYVFSQALRSPANAKSSMRNLKQTPVWGYGYQYVDAKYGKQNNSSYYRDMQAMVVNEWGADSDFKTIGFFGQWDPCGKDQVIDQWQQALPRMSDNTYKYTDVGHFIEEYKGVEMAQALINKLY